MNKGLIVFKKDGTSFWIDDKNGVMSEQFVASRNTMQIVGVDSRLKITFL